MGMPYRPICKTELYDCLGLPYPEGSRPNPYCPAAIIGFLVDSVQRSRWERSGECEEIEEKSGEIWESGEFPQVIRCVPTQSILYPTPSVPLPTPPEAKKPKIKPRRGKSLVSKKIDGEIKILKEELDTVQREMRNLDLEKKLLACSIESRPISRKCCCRYNCRSR